VHLEETELPAGVELAESISTIRTGRWVAAAAIVLILVRLISWLDNTAISKPPVFDRSIAVGPFTTIGDDDAIEAYADGLSAELTALLTEYQELSVIADADADPTFRIR